MSPQFSPSARTMCANIDMDVFYVYYKDIGSMWGLGT